MTAQLRALPVISNVECAELEPSDFREYAARLADRDTSTANLEDEERVFRAIGFIPHSYTYAKCMKHSSTNTAIAMYDRDQNRIILRKDLVAPRSIIAHELVHALQNSAFDLKKLRKKIGNTDEQLAINALVEGDAVVIERQLAQLEHEPPMNRELLASGNVEGCEPPEAITNLFLFPYEWGSRFADERKKADGKFDDLFLSPPRTTREILYPANRNEMSPCQLDEEPLGGRLILEDSFGEFFLRTMFKGKLDVATSVTAAKGLCADRIELRRKEGKDQVSWALKFDSSEEARQAWDGFGKYFLALYGVELDTSAKAWRFGNSEQTVSGQIEKETIQLTMIIESR